jgi:ABC-type phosphate/phosphonate transport system substrate-binding protein
MSEDEGMARPATALAALAALVLAGCGSDSHPARETTGELIVSIEPAELPDHLEDNDC